MHIYIYIDRYIEREGEIHTQVCKYLSLSLSLSLSLYIYIYMYIYTYLYIYLYIYTYIYIYIHTYIERERERERERESPSLPGLACWGLQTLLLVLRPGILPDPSSMKCNRQPNNPERNPRPTPKLSQTT